MKDMRDSSTFATEISFIKDWERYQSISLAVRLWFRKVHLGADSFNTAKERPTYATVSIDTPLSALSVFYRYVVFDGTVRWGHVRIVAAITIVSILSVILNLLLVFFICSIELNQVFLPLLLMMITFVVHCIYWLLMKLLARFQALLWLMSVKLLASSAVKNVIDFDGEVVVVSRSGSLVLRSLVFNDSILAIYAHLFNDNMTHFESMWVDKAHAFI